MEFSLTDVQFEKLQKIKSLISHQVPDFNTATVLEVVFDFFISKKHSTSVVTVQNNTNTQVDIAAQTKTENTVTHSFMKTRSKSSFANPKATQNKINNKLSRYISVSVKKELYTKSQGCCEYVGPTGIRCGSCFKIQIDHHQKAYCFGGDNTLKNLRHLCSQHNLMTASEGGFGFETCIEWKPKI